MFTPPHIASQLAAQRQREMQVQAHERRLRRQFRAQPGRRPVAATTARPCHSWRARAQAVLHALAYRPAMRRPAI